jgi:prevent-host-death family protein
MDTINLADAKARLSDILRKVEMGEEVIVTRRGRAIARITRAGKETKAFRSRAELRAKQKKSKRSSAQLVREVRDAGY